MTEEGTEKTPRALLRRWCDDNSLEFLAFKSEVTAGYIHMIIRGDRTPSKKVARKIERITNGEVKAKGWTKIVPED